MHVRDINTRAVDLAVADLMVARVGTVHADETAYRAAKIMAELDCGCVPVVDHLNAVVGIITDRDIAISAFEEGAPLKAIRVAIAMTRDPISIRADDTIGGALELMRSRQVRRLPVVDAEHRLLGLLTLQDIVRHTAQLRRRGEDAAASDALLETFAAIGERREVNIASLVCAE